MVLPFSPAVFDERGHGRQVGAVEGALAHFATTLPGQIEGGQLFLAADVLPARRQGLYGFEIGFEVGLLECANGLVADDFEQQRHDGTDLAEHRGFVELLVVLEIALRHFGEQRRLLSARQRGRGLVLAVIPVEQLFVGADRHPAVGEGQAPHVHFGSVESVAVELKELLERAAQKLVVADGDGALENAVGFGVAGLVFLDFFEGVGAVLASGFIPCEAGRFGVGADGVDGLGRQGVDAGDSFELPTRIGIRLTLASVIPFGCKASFFVPVSLNGGPVVLGAKREDDFLLAWVAGKDVGRNAPAKIVGAGFGVALQAGGKHWHRS